MPTAVIPFIARPEYPVATYPTYLPHGYEGTYGTAPLGGTAMSPFPEWSAASYFVGGKVTCYGDAGTAGSFFCPNSNDPASHDVSGGGFGDDGVDHIGELTAPQIEVADIVALAVATPGTMRTSGMFGARPFITAPSPSGFPSIHPVYRGLTRGPSLSNFVISPTGSHGYNLTGGTATANDTDYPGTSLSIEWVINGTPSAATPGGVITQTFAPGDLITVAQIVADDYGRVYINAIAWVEPNIRPVAAFSVETDSSDDLAVVLDASDSSDPDNYRDPLIYKWNFGDGNTATVGAPAPGHTYDAETTFTITLIVNDGIDDSLPVIHAFTPESGRNAACFDHAGTLYSALKDPDDASAIRIYRFENFASGTSTREAVAVITDGKAPSLWSDEHGAIWCAAQKRSTGQVLEYRSQNRGKTFDLV